MLPFFLFGIYEKDGQPPEKALGHFIRGRFLAPKARPYREMCRDGICVVTDRYFTKQIRFYDITDQLAQNEDKNRIFEDYCDFLNYFDSSIHVQFSFLNQRIDLEEYQRAICIPEQIDAFNGIREDLQSRNERMFLVTVLVLNLADRRQRLKTDVFQGAGVAQKYIVNATNSAILSILICNFISSVIVQRENGPAFPISVPGACRLLLIVRQAKRPLWQL